MEIVLLFAPLVGSIICGFGHRILGEKISMMVSTGALFISAILSWVVFINFHGDGHTISLFRFIESGSLSADWAIRMDRLTAIMLVVINTVSALVHLYSWGYMDKDPQWKQGESYKPRFFAYLSFFTFAMLMLVTSDNLLQMFFGWEGVGVASYLLIGFYYRKPSAGAAAMKAFIVNRVGDFGFALGIFGLFYLSGSINFSEVLDPHNAKELSKTSFQFLSWQLNALEVITMLLFIGAMGKSAQLMLHTWLPDAMEGTNTCICTNPCCNHGNSGCIHGMPAFSINGICNIYPKFYCFNWVQQRHFLQQQLGWSKMILSVLLHTQLVHNWVICLLPQVWGAYGAAMFHLFTHAFFKAMLFLGAGSVIHAMHHEQDMRNYGALRKKIPYTFAAMMIGTLAITGVGIPLTHYGFAGFLSKDAIIESAYGAGTGVGQYAFVMLVVAAAMTSFYSWRLIFLTFYGKARGNSHTHDHAHESPLVMILPLAVLALGGSFFWNDLV